jgi:hypothetical protein
VVDGTVAAAFTRIALDVARAGRVGYPLAEMNDLLTSADRESIETLPAPRSPTRIV